MTGDNNGADKYKAADTAQYFLLPYNLAFFADNEGGEKTEQPTPRKKQKAREEGQVAKSQELNTAFLFLAVFAGLKLFGPWIYSSIEALFTYGLAGLGSLSETTNPDFMRRYFTYIFQRALIIASPVMIISMTTGIVVNLYQVKWAPTTKPLRPKFSKLNPISGFKRLFSVHHLIELPKVLAKLAIIGFTIYWVIIREIPFIMRFMEMEIMQGLIYVGNTATNLGLRVAVLFLFIAAVDYPYQRYRHTKSIKMTKQEVKDEQKQIDGDPKIKAKIKQKMLQSSMRRMMQEVPGADVIITNPQHYAVAVKYDRLKAAAPIVVAKGVDYAAKKIREKAAEHNIEIVENKPLARALYASVDIGREIPADLYQAVAEVLAFVYKVRNKAQTL